MKNKKIYVTENEKSMIRMTVCSIIALFIVAGIVLCINWRIQVHNEKESLRLAEIAYAEELAEQEEAERKAAEEAFAKQLEIAERKEEDTILMAKLLYGINGFVDNYGYSEGDVRTYGECAINRTLNTRNGFPNTLSEVILQENQWVGFSENNQVIDKYYTIAAHIVSDYYNNIRRPVSSDYCWIDLRRDGCWLKNEYSDSPYVRTWRYSA